MAISAADVKNLREATGVGMMDCKKALSETNGDFEAAVALLREKGLAVAAKREARSASEGIVTFFLSDDKKTGVLAELNCETSFVAKNDEFIALASDIAKTAAVSSAADMDALKTENLIGTNNTIADSITDIMAKIGEKIDAPRFAKCVASDNEAIAGYIHSDNLTGVIVKLKSDSSDVVNSEDTIVLAKDIAMHVAWSNPQYLNVEDVPAEEIAKEREIQVNRAKEEGKPEAIALKMVEGRLQKEFFAGICLIKQPFVKDDKLSIGDLVSIYAKSNGAKVEIAGFVRFKVGEKS